MNTKNRKRVLVPEAVSKLPVEEGWLGSTNGSPQHSQRLGASLRCDPSHPRVLKLLPVALVMAIGLLPVLNGCGGGAQEEIDVALKPSDSGAGGGADNDTTTPPPKVAEGYGTFTGRILFEGTDPKLQMLVNKGDKTVKDWEVCSANNIPNEGFVVGKNGGLANVFIFLRKAPPGAKLENAEEGDDTKKLRTFDQVGCRYVPHAMVLRVGQPFILKTSDPINHNVKSYASNNGDKFDRIIDYQKNKDGVQHTYPEAVAAPFEIKCNFHPWMRGYHLPLDHPYGVVTDANGNFTIKDLPVGTHKFRIWHERSKSTLLDRGFKVTIKEDGDEVDEPKITYGDSDFVF